MFKTYHRNRKRGGAYIYLEMSSWLTALGVPGGIVANKFDEACRDAEFSRTN